MESVTILQTNRLYECSGDKMEKSVDQFKEFVKRHPKLKYQVRDGSQTWQSLYEEWSILGDDESSWTEYEEVITEKVEKESLSIGDGQEFMKSALNYVKKVNPDDITKYINNFQKVLGLVQMFNGGNKNQAPAPQNNARPRRNIDPLFRRYDDYDD